MKRAIAWFAENSVAANLLMLILVVGGLAALPSIQQKTFPDIDVDIIQVGVTYLGAAPEEVEEGVCVRIEEEIQGVEGIERISSSAAEGACGVTAELLAGASVDRALTDIKNAVDGIDTFPAETEKPIVNHLIIRRNAVQIALWGDAEEKALKIWGERLRDAISALPDVTQVELAAAREYEISVEVSEESLRRHGLTFDQVAQAVRRSSLDLPGGSIKTSAGEVLLRTKGQAYRGEEFEKIVVLTRQDGTRLLLGEIATVVDGFEEDDRYAAFNGQPAVLLQVFRVGDQRVLELADRVKQYAAETSSSLPEGLQLTVWRDGSQVLRDRLDILIDNGRGGFILVFVVLACFLRLRLAFWVAIGVPIAFLGALLTFPLFDISIDVISLFAFILVLGLLVDDAIVVGENIHTHQERSEEPLHAAIAGTQEVTVPVIFGVLTTVVAFIPLIASPGPMGQVFGVIGIVVILCLIFSVIESQLILPAHLGHHVKLQERPARPGSLQARWKALQGRLASSLRRIAEERYRPALQWTLDWRYSALTLGLVLLVLTVTLVRTGHMKFSFFPPVESDYVSARLTMPQGTPVAQTVEAVRRLEAAALELRHDLDQEFPEQPPLIRHVLTSVGSQPSSGDRGAVSMAVGSGSHLGEVSLDLIGGDDRPLTAAEITRRWRERVPPIPDLEELSFASDLFSAGDPIAIQLQSADTDALQQAAEELKQRLSDFPGVFDITDSFRDGKEEIQLDILPSAEPLGLTLSDLGRQVRQAFYGEEAQRIQRGRDDIRVMVRYPESERRSLDDLDNLRIRTPDGGEVPFYAVAEARLGRGYANIKRADRRRVIDVTADIDAGQANANEILGQLRKDFLPGLLAAHPGLTYSLEGEQKEQQKTLAALVRNLLFALLGIYALLAIPLRSYAQPLLIMAVIPFGLVGAIGGHLIMGGLVPALGRLSMMSVFGVVALSGVVVNSSLVLVHTVNQGRAWGLPVREAVVRAGVARFRPIVLTSMTTFAGLTPLLLERSLSAQFLIPMATSLAFGVAFATVISLLLLPASYLILDDLSGRWQGRDPEPARRPARLTEVAPIRAAGR